MSPEDTLPNEEGDMIKSSRRREIKMLLVIVFICFVIAAVFSFITGELPSFIDRMIYKRVAKQIERAKKEAVEDLSDEEKERFRKEFERYTK